MCGVVFFCPAPSKKRGSCGNSNSRCYAGTGGVLLVACLLVLAIWLGGMACFSIKTSVINAGAIVMVYLITQLHARHQLRQNEDTEVVFDRVSNDSSVWHAAGSGVYPGRRRRPTQVQKPSRVHRRQLLQRHCPVRRGDRLRAWLR